MGRPKELESLHRLDERAHWVVEMRYFGGMEIEEIAEFRRDSSSRNFVLPADDCPEGHVCVDPPSP